MDEQMEQYMDVVKKCATLVADCGFKLPEITYSLYKRVTKTIGRCTTRKIKRNMTYSIWISEFYFKYTIEHDMIHNLEEIILHEMCHALPNGMNHGIGWNKYIDIINSKYGYHIKRIHSTDDATKAMTRITHPYDVICLGCGDTCYANKRQASNISDYRCPHCKGQLSITNS